MKKISFLLIMILFLSGCTQKNASQGKLELTKVEQQKNLACSLFNGNSLTNLSSQAVREFRKLALLDPAFTQVGEEAGELYMYMEFSRFTTQLNSGAPLERKIYLTAKFQQLCFKE